MRDPYGFEREPMSRREFFVRSAAVVGLAYVAADALNDALFGEDDKKSETNTVVHDTMFDSKEANDVAADLLIEPSSYWQTESETMSAISDKSDWDKDDTLFPIYPAAIMKFEPVMKKVADELDVPVNIIGIIASIESAGKTDADSNVANGLFQVVPEFHREKIDKVAKDNGKQEPRDDNERIELLQDPYIGCRVGMQILLEYRNTVISENSGLNPESPIIWARALASYNGGPSNAGKKYDDMPLESQLYAVHAIRYITDAAIASGLRAKGMNNHDIHAAMVSPRIDRDTYSYSKAVDAAHGLGSISDYESIWTAIAGNDKRDKKMNQILAQARKDFTAGKSGYKLPLTPALRIWAAHGGLSLLSQTKSNLDPNNYKF